MTNEEAREDELLALASIYDGTVFSVDDSGEEAGGELRAFPPLPRPYYIKTKGAVSRSVHVVEHLPPIALHFRLPPAYPSTRPPTFSLSCKWLNARQLSILCRRLDDIWKENAGDVVLFRWIGFLNDETFDVLGLTDGLEVDDVDPSPAERQISTRDEKREEAKKARRDGPPCRGYRKRGVVRGRYPRGKGGETSGGRRRLSEGLKCGADNDGVDPRAIGEIDVPSQLLAVLLDYDQQQRQRAFDADVFDCNVCFEKKRGSECLSMKPCNHVFCRECLKGYFEVQISSGNVQKLNCPEDGCSSQALPSQVRDLVNSNLYAKYDELLLTSTLDSMADVVYCPRICCQCPVLKESDGNMGSCPACFYVFCIYCRMTYHGVAPCRWKADERLELVNEFVKASTEEKQLLERRYGKQQLRNLLDDTLSEEWVRGNSKMCPNCNARIEKLDGCNKMTCWKCSTYFCWLCLERLTKGNPYDHYSNPDSKCNGHLFQGADLDFEDDDEDDNYNDWEFEQFL